MSGFLKSIGYALKTFKPDRCVIIFDGPGGSMKRRKIYPEYKNHRKNKIRLNRFYDRDASPEDSNASMEIQLQKLVNYLQNLPVNIVILPNVEADDSIAYLSLDFFKDWDSIIMSADKDFLQIVNNRIKVWSPTKKRIYGPADVLNEYGISSQNFVYFRVLSGDTSDNIPAIRGCGLKTIIKAFPFLAESDGGKVELNKIYDYSMLNKGKLKVYETITEHWSDVERNYELMQLTSTQLQTYAQLHVCEILRNPIPKLNQFELIKLTNEDNIFNSPIWIQECFSKLNSFVVN